MAVLRAHLRHRLILAALAGLALIAVSEGAWWRDASVRAGRAHRELEQRRREWRALASLSPSPTPTVARQIEEELAGRRQVIAELDRRLGWRGPLAESLRATTPLRGQTEEFFETVAFRERMKAGARASGIKVKADERFGFDDSRRAAGDARPVQADIRDRLAAEHLLGVLFAAGPQELLAVERKVTQEADARALPRVAFRLAFAGETRALRGLLNGLAEAEGPWRVREVDVEAAGQATVAKALIAEAGPRVPRMSSRFVVTVELAPAAEKEG